MRCRHRHGAFRFAGTVDGYDVVVEFCRRCDWFKWQTTRSVKTCSDAEGLSDRITVAAVARSASTHLATA